MVEPVCLRSVYVDKCFVCILLLPDELSLYIQYKRWIHFFLQLKMFMIESLILFSKFLDLFFELCVCIFT
jgi:hypothetical protein